MSLFINDKINPVSSGTVSSGNLGLFAGSDDIFYAKKSDGSFYPITSTISGYNSSLIFSTSSYILSITDGNSTQTASLADLASGYYNAFLSISTSSNVLTLIDGYSTLTASLSYYAGGFNNNISYNTASNVLSITDGQGTISATLSNGANTRFTFNQINNILSIVDDFSTKTASLAALSGNTSLTYNNGVLSLTDGRGTLTASISTTQLLSAELTILSADVLTLNSVPIEIIPTPGAGKAIEVISASRKLDFNTTPYATNTRLILKTTSGNVEIMNWGSGGLNTNLSLSPYTSNILSALTSNSSSSTAQQLFENEGVFVSVLTGDPTAGDSDIKVYVTYRIITL